MTRRFTFRQRVRYRFDNSLSRGIWGVLAWLGLMALILLIIVAFLSVILGLIGDQSANFFDGFWYGLTRFLDSGTMSGDAGAGRIFGLAITIVGIFLAAAIIGLVSSSIDSRVDSMRRGRSLVVENGHTLILGKSDKVLPVVSELIEANASQRDAAIVLLTPDDTVEMTEFVTGSIDDFKTSRLVVRSGNPTRIPDLRTTNPESAKSIIVLRPADGSDAEVVMTVLGVLQIIGDANIPVVAEFEDPETAAAISQAAGDRVIAITSTEIVGRIGAQVTRMPGLGAIYQEFLDFDGDELYTTPVTEAWVGRSFGEVLLGSSRGTIIGLHGADGATRIGPDPHTVLQRGDAVIGIAEDDSVFRLDQAPIAWNAADRRSWESMAEESERTLVICWSPLAPLVARELDSGVAPGSELHILVDVLEEAVEAIATSFSLQNQELVIHTGSSINRADVHAVLDRGPFNHIVVMSERQLHDATEADARSLLTLLHVRSHPSVQRSQSVVAELIDPSAAELAGSSDSADFIVSQRLVALLMAQLSETPALKPVFDDMFDVRGATIEVQPAERYVAPGATTFGQLIEAGRAWGVVVIGYRAESAKGRPGTLMNGARLNPPKDEQVVLAEGDALIVITRD